MSHSILLRIEFWLEERRLIGWELGDGVMDWQLIDSIMGIGLVLVDGVVNWQLDDSIMGIGLVLVDSLRRIGWELIDSFMLIDSLRRIRYSRT